MAISKGSPYTSFFRRMLYKLTENGQITLIKTRYLAKPKSCYSGTGSSGQPLGLYKVVMLFIILTFGGLISTAIFLWEQCRKKCCQAPKAAPRQKKVDRDFKREIRNLNTDLCDHLIATIQALENNDIDRSRTLLQGVHVIASKYDSVKAWHDGRK